MGVGTDLAIIHFPVAQLFHLCFLGWHDADSDLGRLAEVRTIECNRRNRPTPQSLPGFLAQALEESVFDHIASHRHGRALSLPVRWRFLLLSRLAARAGFVTQRQTFVRRCQTL